MIRNLKALGLASLAVFAMGAMAASVAQAGETDGKFTASEYPATIVGQQTEQHVFDRQNRKVTCEIAEFHGTVEEAGTTATLVPTYEKCHSKVLGNILPATVTVGCGYTFHATAHEKEGGGHTFTADVSLDCVFVIHIYTSHTKHTANEPACVITVGEQEGLETIDLTNITGPPDYLLAHITIGGISSTVAPAGALCGSETDSEGTLEGTATLEGENEGGEAIGLTVSTDETE